MTVNANANAIEFFERNGHHTKPDRGTADGLPKVSNLQSDSPNEIESYLGISDVRPRIFSHPMPA